MTPIGWLPDVLASEGLAVTAHDGWEDRGRPRPYRPTGVIVHHTGPGSDSMLIDMCINGREGLAGPLCNAVVDSCGGWHVIAGGTANHAGVGRLPWGGIDGNAGSIGIEAVNPGDGAAWPAVQVDSLLSGISAILAHQSWPVGRVTTHADYAEPAGRKNDPAGRTWFSPSPGTWPVGSLRAALWTIEDVDMPIGHEIVAELGRLNAIMADMNNRLLHWFGLAGEGWVEVNAKQHAELAAKLDRLIQQTAPPKP